MLEIAKNIIKEKFTDDSEQEFDTELKLESKNKSILNEHFIECFLAFTNPKLYRILMITKGKPNPLVPILKQYNDTMKYIKNFNREYNINTKLEVPLFD